MVKLVHNVQKKQHRERAQPQDRARFGFLEKKKDYRLRAADYHKKQAQLKILKQKAKLRNDDEYYHSMTRRKTDKDGVLIAERGNEVLSNDEVLLLKTQDANYLTMTRQSEARKIEKEMKNLDSFKGAGSHTVFVDSEEQLEQFDPVQYFDTDASLLGKRENRLRKSQLSGLADGVSDGPVVPELAEDGYLKHKLELKKLKKLRLLEQRMEREEKLKKLQATVELQKQLMKKGEKKKVQTKDGRTVFKWKNPEESHRGVMKLVVLGACGGIGQTLSLLLRTNALIDELVLYDVVDPAGVATDLSHIPTRQQVRHFCPLSKTDDSQLRTALQGANIVVIPAGIPRKPGMSRDDLFNINASIVQQLVRVYGEVCPEAFLAIISNPVNSTVPIAAEQLRSQSCYHPEKVFGITTLDTLRLEQFLGELTGAWDLRGQVYTVGGHSGETIMPVLGNWRRRLSSEQIENLAHRVRYAGDEVVQAKQGKGSATLSMAAAANRFLCGILRATCKGETVDEVAFVNVSRLKTDDCFVREMMHKVEFFGVPIRIGPEGVAKVGSLGSLSTDEKDAILRSVPTLCAQIAKGARFVKESKL
ncbi:hypothetical protein KL919_001063 [Ogataea angusta]|nr:hypothetical protein KL919_001063 [Ogataea angusta]